MSNTTLLNTPVLWINKYLQQKLASGVGIGVPIFPTKPSTIDELTEGWVTIDSQNYDYAGVMGTWDRLVKMRRSPFPHVRSEQLLYYFYATESDVTELMVQVQENILRLMDRGDETAEEINNWAMNRKIDLGNNELIDNMFYFHSFKVYQLEETRDIIDFGTARTFGGNKIIIDFEYHQNSEIANSGWTPEPKLAQKITI